jgi:hypothetical protein
MAWGALPALAQFELPATLDDAGGRPAVDPFPARRALVLAPRNSSPSSEPAAGAAVAADESNTAADRDNRPDRDRDHHHGHHHPHHGGTWLIWPPIVWGGYPQIFPPYGPGYPSYVQRGFSVTLPAPAPRAIQRPAPAAPAAQGDKPKVRVTNAEWKARAGKFIGFGDTNFGKQSYLSAVERYKTAAEMAPDLAEPYLRQGFAFVAMGQYESAVKAFRRGLKIRSDWSDSPFRLDQIYGDAQIAKTAHLENLAKAVEANPLDSELLVALGMQLFFDGQPERSEVFFARAAQLGGNDDKLLDDFLPRPAPAGAPRPDKPPKPGGKIVF